MFHYVLMLKVKPTKVFLLKITLGAMVIVNEIMIFFFQTAMLKLDQCGQKQ